MSKLEESKAKMLEAMSWTEFKRNSEQIKTVIIPWGAVEAHGAHLPLSTDTILAYNIGKKIADKLGVFLLPPIPVGYSFHAANFPGTISFSPETIQNMAFEIAESLRKHGIQNIIFLSGHGGNVEPLEIIAEEIKEKLKINVVVLFLYYTGDSLIEKFKQITTSESVSDIFHAEELETSLMLAVAPDLVQMREAIAEYPKVTEEYLGYEKKLGDLTKYCVFGDPTVATVAKGNKIIDIMVDEILTICRRLI